MPSTNSDSARRPRGPVLAAARERFLTVGTLDSDQVRETIAASWWRSRSWQVAADQVQLEYVKDPNLETPLVSSAAPILDRLQEQVSDEAVSIILTDAGGVVLDRRTGDRKLEAHLDRVQLAPGFSYAEQYVGTNGIGTALEGGTATGVFGHEHYAENLGDLDCAGVPVRHPVSGRLLGVVDLTCWSSDAGPMMLALAKTTAANIERELTTLTGLREFALFQEYLRACKRSNGIVLALNNDLVMMNDHAHQVLAPQDQAALLAAAAEAMVGSKRVSIDVRLPSGLKARVFCSPVHTESGPAGGVARVRLTQDTPRTPPSQESFSRSPLPGLAGSSALWNRACKEVCAHHRSGEWVTVHGEVGAGKKALLRAVHYRHNPAGRFQVIDAADTARPAEFAARVRREFEEHDGTVVLAHIDRLSADGGRALAGVLHEQRRMDERTGRRHWVAATHCRVDHDDGGTGLLHAFHGSVEVPPLRHRIEDLRELLPCLLSQLTPHTALSCSPATTQLLMRAAWPGNVAQLRQALEHAVRHRRTGVVEPGDLPPEYLAVARRILNPMESLERDAIVRALLDARGNKNEAARAVGLSRATIYRKIREYGINLPH